MFKSLLKSKQFIGVADAKDALQDIVAYLKKPGKFSELGAQPPKGIVLEGDSGAGKTLLARAAAGEAGVPFIALSGGDFSDMFLGVGVRRVKKLFVLARRQAPCVVFIDEIDGLGRRSGASSAAETENNRIINTLLVELDGFSPASGIVVMGATNNARNLDPALIRPGRFNRVCNLALPDVDEREALFALYASRLRTEGGTDFRPLARLAAGLSPAAIANAVNAAALLAAKEDAAAVIGPFSYAGLPDRERRIADHPEAIAEAREIAKALESECAALLLAHRPALERLTAELLEHEMVSGEVVDACLAADGGKKVVPLAA